MNSKTQLAIALSKLEVFLSPKPQLEQYPTDSEIAADILWTAYMEGELENKSIADLGCGTGILGIGALLLGAKKVLFVEKDESVLITLKKNLESLGIENDDLYEIWECDVRDFFANVDIVIQNPPFGTREKHIDKLFLEKAISIADIVYSFHKTTTKKFITAFSRDNKLNIMWTKDFSFPLKQTLDHHKSKIKRIEISCFKLKK